MRIFTPVSYDFWLIQIHWDNLWDTLNLVGTSHGTGTVAQSHQLLSLPTIWLCQLITGRGYWLLTTQVSTPCPNAPASDLSLRPAPVSAPPDEESPGVRAKAYLRRRAWLSRCVMTSDSVNPLKGWFVGYFISLYKTSSKVNTSVHWSMASLKENVVKP